MGVAAPALALLLLALLPNRADAAEPARGPLLQGLAGADVDWESGKVAVRSGAAADLRLPGPDAARPAARRAAEKRAAESLTQALRLLPLGGGRKPSAKAVAAAVARAQSKDFEYQSNGGVLLTLEADFADLTAGTSDAEEDGKAPGDKTAAPKDKPAKLPPKTALPPAARNGAVKANHVERSPARGAGDDEILIAVASMPLEVAPRVLVGGLERRLGSAVYRLGAPPKASKALSAKRDKGGRLVVNVPTADAAQQAERLDGARAVIFVRNVAKR